MVWRGHSWPQVGHTWEPGSALATAGRDVTRAKTATGKQATASTEAEILWNPLSLRRLIHPNPLSKSQTQSVVKIADLAAVQAPRRKFLEPAPLITPRGGAEPTESVCLAVLCLCRFRWVVNGGEWWWWFGDVTLWFCNYLMQFALDRFWKVAAHIPSPWIWELNVSIYHMSKIGDHWAQNENKQIPWSGNSQDVVLMHSETPIKPLHISERHILWVWWALNTSENPKPIRSSRHLRSSSYHHRRLQWGAFSI